MADYRVKCTMYNIIMNNLKKNQFSTFHFQLLLLSLQRIRKRLLIFPVSYMVLIAQLVRALDCGSKGRGFESHSSPNKFTSFTKKAFIAGGFFL